jgi:hypothetical protein
MPIRLTLPAEIIDSIDIIEEILGHEIVDETDAFVDGSHAVKVDRTEGFEMAKLRLLGSKMGEEKLTYIEAKAVTSHLLSNYPHAVDLLTEHQVERLVQGKCSDGELLECLMGFYGSELLCHSSVCPGRTSIAGVCLQLIVVLCSTCASPSSNKSSITISSRHDGDSAPYSDA